MQKSKRGLRASLLMPLTGIYFEHTVPRGLEDFAKHLERKHMTSPTTEIRLQRQRDDFYVYEAWLPTKRKNSPFTIRVSGSLKHIDNSATLVSGRAGSKLWIGYTVDLAILVIISLIIALTDNPFAALFVGFTMFALYLFRWWMISRQYQSQVQEIAQQLQ